MARHRGHPNDTKYAGANFTAMSDRHISAKFREFNRKLIVAFGRFHCWLYEATDGRLGRRMMRQDMILLWTTGRRSGQRRHTALRCELRSDEVLVVASFYGAPHNPAWFLNLKADPNCEVRSGLSKYAAQAVVLEGDERSRAWDELVAGWPAYASYQEATERVLPVVALRRAVPGGF